MLVRILKLLNEDQLKAVEDVIASGQFEDGAITTGAPTKAVKNNEQLALASHPGHQEILRGINELFLKHPLIRSTALPLRITPPLISRYREGQAYGWHIDNPIMTGIGGPVRSDLACTIFLSDSSTYDGGELHLRTQSGDARVKLERGDAVIYPATFQHEVTAVTRGERLALVLWIQSMIADPGKREVLHELNMAYNHVMKENPGSEALQLIQRTQSNLIRRWAEN